MASSFPTALTGAKTDYDNEDQVGSADQNAQGEDVNAIAAKVGIDGSAVATSHDYKLSGVTGSDKSASKAGSETLTNKTLTSPVLTTPQVDTVGEETTTAGVTVDGVLLKDSEVTTDVINEKTATTGVTVDGILLKDDLDTSGIVGKTTTQTLTNKTLTSPAFNGAVDGWISANQTWTYASATTITVPAGAVAKYQKGDKIKLTQTTAKYFYVVGVADTVLTVTGGIDYTVANAAITLPYYSKVSNPQGHPGWFNYVPTVNGAGGSIGSYTYTNSICGFSINGRVVHYVVNGRVTDVGSWSGNVQISVPVAPSTTADNRTHNLSAGMIGGSGLTILGYANSITSTLMTFVEAFTVTALQWSTMTGADTVAIQIDYEI